MFFNAYLITNTINGKQYVGVTLKTLEKRWAAHVRASRRENATIYLHRAIRKYGVENFCYRLIATASNKKSLLRLETALIEKYNTLTPNGYNLTKGGRGSLGFKFTPEQKEKLRLRPKRTLSMETRIKISLGNKGKHYHSVSEETRAKLRAINLGKKNGPKSEEAKAAISLKNKRRWAFYTIKDIRRIRRNISEGRRRALKEAA